MAGVARRAGWCAGPLGTIFRTGRLVRFTACVSGVGSELNCPERSPGVPRSITRNDTMSRGPICALWVQGISRVPSECRSNRVWTACGPSGTFRLPADWLQYGFWLLSLALSLAEERLADQNMKRKLRGRRRAAAALAFRVARRNVCQPDQSTEFLSDHAPPRSAQLCA